jgi:hypothetical protein
MFDGNKLDYDAIYRLLVSWQIGIYYNDTAGMRDMIIVKKNGKFVRQLSMNDVFKMLEEYALETYDGNLNELYKSQQITQTSFYRKLPRFEITKYKDDKNSVTFFFKNKVIQVTKDNIQAYNYNEFDTGNALIWESHLIDFDVDVKEAEAYKSSNWYDFCSKAVDGGINQLMQCCGYMVHNYKDPTNAKIVVFADASQQSGANGGSGKTLIGYNGTLKVRKVDYLEGKKFDPESQFAFQTIDEYADLVVIDDVQQNFKYQHLYNAASNDMTIERKYSAPIRLPFKYSPTFLVTSNYGIVNQGGSDKRRRVVIAFSDYFNINNTVYDEYKQEFFKDWTKKEWNRFYGFYFEAARMFLRNGLEDYRSYEVDKKALSGVIGSDFVEYVERNINRWIGEDRGITATQLHNSMPEWVSLENKEETKKKWQYVVHANNYKIKEKRKSTGRLFWIEKTDKSNEPEQTSIEMDEQIPGEDGDDMPF